MSASKIEEILCLFRRQESSDGDLGMDGDLGISSLTIRERSDAEKGEVSPDEWIGPSNAIEGYVPNYDRNRGEIILLFQSLFRLFGRFSIVNGHVNASLS